MNPKAWKERNLTRLESSYSFIFLVKIAFVTLHSIELTKHVFALKRGFYLFYSIINTVWGAPLISKHSNRLQFSGAHDNRKLHLIKSTTRGVKCLTSPTYTCIYSCQLMNLFSLETSHHSSPPRGGGRGFGLFLRTIDPLRNRNLRSQAPKGGKRGGDSGWMQ